MLSGLISRLHLSSHRPLFLGLVNVIVAQLCAILLHTVLRNYCNIRYIQKDAPKYDSKLALKNHLSSPEGFAELGLFLIGSWYLKLYPSLYYIDNTEISWTDWCGSWLWKANLFKVLIQLLLVDFYQFLMHKIEHTTSLYIIAHKTHHGYYKPIIYNAFSGSLSDTLFLILVPLQLTSMTLWKWISIYDYIGFGTCFATYLFLIHSEFYWPWDFIFNKLGIGTPADHQIHHATIIYNYGHFFTYWDRLTGTYKEPTSYFKTTIPKPIDWLRSSLS